MVIAAGGGKLGGDIAKPDSVDIPIWRKASMTVEEAARYSNIGESKIRELCKDPLLKISFQVRLRDSGIKLI